MQKLLGPFGLLAGLLLLSGCGLFTPVLKDLEKQMAEKVQASVDQYKLEHDGQEPDELTMLKFKAEALKAVTEEAKDSGVGLGQSIAGIISLLGFVLRGVQTARS